MIFFYHYPLRQLGKGNYSSKGTYKLLKYKNGFI